MLSALSLIYSVSLIIINSPKTGETMDNIYIDEKENLYYHLDLDYHFNLHCKEFRMETRRTSIIPYNYI